MRTAVFKIRPEFINAIKKGTKRHEYRLNKGNRSVLDKGDHLYLVANDDSGSFAEVTITGKKTFSSWEEALSEFWSEDFRSIFSSLEEAVNTCQKFYSDSDVKAYGIVVFSIVPFSDGALQRSNVLIDGKLLDDEETRIACNSLIERLKVRGCSNVSVKPPFDGMPSDQNDILDSYFLGAAEGMQTDQIEILYSLYSRKYDYLITNDAKLLSCCKAIFCNNRLISLGQAQSLLDRSFAPIRYDVLKVVNKKFGELDINDPFFDSLKDDYPEFSKWFVKKSGSDAYVFLDESGKLRAFLYLKIEGRGEDYSDINPILPPARRMKVGTFKIESGDNHFRLSERFFKAIFDNALQEGVDEVYVTLFEGRKETVEALKNNLLKWGFRLWGTKTNGESVYVKDLRTYDSEKSVIENFPLFTKDTNLYWLPIYGAFHDLLFPDSIPGGISKEGLDLNLGSLYALEKIYLTNVSWASVPCGSRILIYRMGKEWPKKRTSLVTGECILNWIKTAKSLDELKKLCKNKSVFNDGEIVKFWSKKTTTVVSLLYLRRFKQPIPLAELWEKGIIQEPNGPRVLDEVKDEETVWQLIERGNR